MNTYLLVKKGESHPIYCEDFVMKHETNEKIIFAVLDGCSSGIDSHFASALIGKTIRKNMLHGGLKEIMRHTFSDLKQMQVHLRLDEDELLATVLLGIYEKDTEKCEILAVGDGYVLLDDQLHEIDQHNMPDYLGYYLLDDFESWWQRQQIYRATHPQRIAISTDGIDTFRTYKTDLPENFHPIQYLLFDDQWKALPTMLARKANVLHSQYGYLPADDIGLVLMIGKNK